MARDKEQQAAKGPDKNKEAETSCLGCGKKLAGTHCHQCTICGLWIHKTCSAISDEFFKHLEDQVKNTGMAYWACRPCQNYAQGITKKMKSVEKRVDDVVNNVEEVKKDLKEVKDGVDRVGERMKKVEEAAATSAENSTNQVFQELREREVRKHNLVLQGVPECDQAAATGKERQNWDFNKCEEICRELGLSLDREAFKFCRRVGAATEGPRPLIVGFYTEMERSLLLRKARNLAETSYSDVTVAPDLTKRQRQEERELWDEAAKKNVNRSSEQLQKNLEWAVVGSRGEKRLVLQPSRPPLPGRGRGGGARGGQRGTAIGAATARGRGQWRPHRGNRGARQVTRTAGQIGARDEEEGEMEADPQEEPAGQTAARKRTAETAGLEGQSPPEKR